MRRSVGDDIRKAFARHQQRSNKNEPTTYWRKNHPRQVVIEGDLHYVPLWGGNNAVVGTGKIALIYYSSTVYEYDFATHRVTDFDMSRYSMSTARNVRSFHYEVGRLLHPDRWTTGGRSYSGRVWVNTYSFTPESSYHQFMLWTTTEHSRYVRKWDARIIDRVKENAPWLSKDRGNYYVTLCPEFTKHDNQYHDAWRTLRRDQRWRYLTITWQNGELVWAYVDEKAKKNFISRAKKRGLSEAEALAEIEVVLAK